MIGGRTTTHLRGTADPSALAAGAPVIELTGATTLALPRVRVLQVVAEIACDRMQEALPPGLHPSIPGHVAWQVWAADESPLGPFRLAMNRVGARSGVKPRCFTTLVLTDSPAVADRFRDDWGYRVQLGEVSLRPAYDRVEGTVRAEAGPILDVELRNPFSFTGAIRYAPNLTLAHTDRGLRLIQVDADYDFHQIDRGRAIVHRFDSDAWQAPAVVPASPVVATYAVVDITLHELRFIADPSLLAIDGTEDLRPKISAGVVA